MCHRLRFAGSWLAAFLAVAAAQSVRAAQPEADAVAESEKNAGESADVDCGLDGYSQGGVVVGGVAYFTANDESRTLGSKRPADFPSVVAFDAHTFRKLRTYAFAKTYDSSPLVLQDKAGRWLVLAHEHQKSRTAARNRETGSEVWTSEANQPGAFFFGYSYYTCILNVPYFNGFFYAETQDLQHQKSNLFRIRATDGQLAEVLDYGRAITSCAPCIIAGGRLFSGDLWQDRVVVSELATNGRTDWPGPFGDPQTNQNAAPPDPGAQAVPIREVRSCEVEKSGSAVGVQTADEARAKSTASQTNYLAAVLGCLDTLIAEGTDRYGSEHSPKWIWNRHANILDAVCPSPDGQPAAPGVRASGLPVLPGPSTPGGRGNHTGQAGRPDGPACTSTVVGQVITGT